MPLYANFNCKLKSAISRKEKIFKIILQPLLFFRTLLPVPGAHGCHTGLWEPPWSHSSSPKHPENPTSPFYLWVLPLHRNSAVTSWGATSKCGYSLAYWSCWWWLPFVECLLGANTCYLLYTHYFNPCNNAIKLVLTSLQFLKLAKVLSELMHLIFLLVKMLPSFTCLTYAHYADLSSGFLS